jgi:hypothetical protein
MRSRLLMLAMLAAACRKAESRAELPALGPALRAAIGDLDGDGRGEIALADADRLRVVDRAGHEMAAVPAPGGIQALAVARLEGRGALLAGWGRDRAHPQARARVSLYRLEGGGLREEVVVAPDSERPQIAAIVPAPPDLLVAWYDSQYQVKSALARRAADGSWRLDELALLRTAASYALGDVDGDGQRDLVVGRFYGDQLASDGDAFLLRPGGARVAIPTTRGVQAIALADGDGDGRLEVYLADGWHKDYGKLARALLTGARWTGADGFRAEPVDELVGEYTIWSLLAADLDGDRRPELVARGTGSVRVYRWQDGAWRGRKVAGEVSDVAAGQVDGAPGDELLVVGASGARWIGGAR